MGYPNWLNEIIRCPETGKPLKPSGDVYIREDGKQYKVQDGILSIVYPETLSGEDAQMNQTYELLAPFYDFFEQLTWRLFIGSDIVQDRKDLISQIKFPSGIRLLEVSPGSGVFQRALREQITAQGKIVSLDLSMNMLRQCQTRNKSLDIHLIHGNAQHLPFDDNSFDGLYHFGGINLFNDPDQAIRECIRVVKKIAWSVGAMKGLRLTIRTILENPC